MTFVKQSKDKAKLFDTVFAVVDKAKEAKEKYGHDCVIDASIGSLCDEEGKLVAFDSLYSNFKSIDNKVHAKYAQSFSGNDSFKKSIDNFFFKNIDFNLPHKIIATPGGTGAVSTTLANLSEKGDIILLPCIAWSSYFLMAKEFNLIAKTYPLFNENKFDTASLKKLVLETLTKQDQVTIVINDPCHNPTGYSLSLNEWQELIDFFNSLPSNKRIVLLNDVAYIDYSFNLKENKKYLESFNNINENISLIVAYSCSKSFTSYGLRIGAAIIANKNINFVNEIYEAYEKTARSMWSNINNGAMNSVTNVLESNETSYLNEKQEYIKLLKQRSEIILKEAHDVNLSCYPYKEGFFITLKVKDNLIDIYHDALLKNNIFTVKVSQGIRLAVCSLPINKCYGFAKKLKDILESIENI